MARDEGPGILGAGAPLDDRFPQIPELADQLVTAKNNYKLLHPTEDFKGVCIIQSDKTVEFKMLRKVMFSAAAAGYQNVNFAVRPKAKGGVAPAAAE